MSAGMMAFVPLVHLRGLTRGPAPPKVEPEKKRHLRDHQRIRCPQCGWQPKASSRWYCGRRGATRGKAACGCVWNTFDTRGLCPSCCYQWTQTVCLSCHGWSRHEDWYEESGDG